MVSDTITELIDFGLRKLTRDLVDRGQTIFGEIPILFACAEKRRCLPHTQQQRPLEPRRAARDAFAAGAS